MTEEPAMLSVPTDEYKLLHAIAYSARFASSGTPYGRIHADMLPAKLARLDDIQNTRNSAIDAALGRIA